MNIKLTFMEGTQSRVGRFHESHFSNTWTRDVLLGWSPKTNHCHYVIISTSIVITSVSAEYLWPTALKEPNVSYGLCLFAYLEYFSYVGLQGLFFTSNIHLFSVFFHKFRNQQSSSAPLVKLHQH